MIPNHGIATRRSEMHKSNKSWSNPEARKRVAEATKKIWADPELRKRMSAAIRKCYSDNPNAHA